MSGNRSREGLTDNIQSASTALYLFDEIDELLLERKICFYGFTWVYSKNKCFFGHSGRINLLSLSFEQLLNCAPQNRFSSTTGVKLMVLQQFFSFCGWHWGSVVIMLFIQSTQTRTHKFLMPHHLCFHSFERGKVRQGYRMWWGWTIHSRSHNTSSQACYSGQHLLSLTMNGQRSGVTLETIHTSDWE